MMNPNGYPMHRRKRFFLIPVFILLFFLLSGIVEYLWNMVLPQAVHAGVLNYWQAAGLLLLSRILFGSFRPGRHGGAPGFGGMPRHIREKWMNMNDEERARFKEEFKARGYNRGH